MVRARAKVYVTDPWYRQVNAIVWAMGYYRIKRKGFRIGNFGLKYRIPRRGHLLGYLTTSSSFMLYWYMIPKGRVRGWTNIVHFTTGPNCCSRTSRIPACWFQPNVNRLHCSASNPGNGNDWLNCNRWLHRNRRFFVKLTVIRNDFRISVNSKLCSRKTLRRKMVRARAKVYVTDPWYRQVNAIVWAMGYRRLRKSKSRFRPGNFGLSYRIPRRGHLLGRLTTHRNFRLQWYMIPKGKVRGWSSIVHFTTGGNCCGRTQRIPGCWFQPNANRLHCSASNPGNGNDWLNCNRWLHRNRRFRIQVTVIGRNFRIYVNGRLCARKTLRRNMVRARAKVYVSDPWYRQVNAIVWAMGYRKY